MAFTVLYSMCREEWGGTSGHRGGSKVPSFHGQEWGVLCLPVLLLAFKEVPLAEQRLGFQGINCPGESGKGRLRTIQLVLQVHAPCLSPGTRQRRGVPVSAL